MVKTLASSVEDIAWIEENDACIFHSEDDLRQQDGDLSRTWMRFGDQGK